MGKMDDDIVELVGPPGKKSKYSKGDDDAAEPDEEGDDEAAELSAFEEYKDALQNGTSEEGLAAYKKLRDICG